MIHKEGTFSGVGGIKLYYQCWLPQHAKAIVLICHGVADHGGRYVRVAQALVEAGYAVYAHDHRGHGRSEGARLHVDRFQLFIDELDIFREAIATKQPDRAIFLFAHSMGSAVGLGWLAEHPGDVAGFISSGTALVPGRGFPPWLVRLNALLARFLPRLRLISLPAQGISRDTEWVRATYADPLIHHGPGTVRLAAEISGALERATRDAECVRVPLLIIHGQEDILTDIRGAHLLHERASSEDKTLMVYEGAYHEVFNDAPEARRAVLRDLIRWLDARCTGLGSDKGAFFVDTE